MALLSGSSPEQRFMWQDYIKCLAHRNMSFTSPLAFSVLLAKSQTERELLHQEYLNAEDIMESRLHQRLWRDDYSWAWNTREPFISCEWSFLAGSVDWQWLKWLELQWQWATFHSGWMGQQGCQPYTRGLSSTIVFAEVVSIAPDINTAVSFFSLTSIHYVHLSGITEHLLYCWPLII